MLRPPLPVVVFTLIFFGLGFFTVICSSLLVYGLLWIGVPHRLLLRCIDCHNGAMMSIFTTTFENLFPLKIRTFGHKGKFKKRSLILMNHRSLFDWMYFWSVFDRQADLTYWKAIIARDHLRNLPVLGQSMQLACNIFVHRKWERDREEFRKSIYYHNAIDYPVQLVLFPEGGFMPQRKTKSDKFADDNNLPRLQYCFYPRTIGFIYTINALRDHSLDAVYDVTIAFPDVLPKNTSDFASGIIPQEVHYYIKMYDNKDIPRDEEGLVKWIRERWIEKDRLLKRFYENRQYQEDDGTKSLEVKRPRNLRFLVQSLLFFTFSDALALISFWYFPYISTVYFISCVVFIAVMHHRGLGHVIMDFKMKEIETAALQNKHKL